MERRTQSTRISNANQWARNSDSAGALLRFQCLDGEEANRKAALHPSQSGSARTGAVAGTMAVEQFSLVLLRRGGASENQRRGHSGDDNPPAGGVIGWFADGSKIMGCPRPGPPATHRGRLR